MEKSVRRTPASPARTSSNAKSRRCSSRAGRAPAWYDAGRMLKGFTHAHLACGCRIAFREGVEGSPVTVVIDQKSPACTLSLHVRDLPLFDYREALRPSTRLGPREEGEFEEEG